MYAHPKLRQYIALVQADLHEGRISGDQKKRNIRRRLARRCRNIVAEMLTKYTPKTVKGYLSVMRKEFTDEPYVLRYLVLPEEVANAINSEYTQALKRHKQTPDRLITAAAAKSLVESAISALAAKPYLEVAAGLVCLTGRRPVEILRTGVFIEDPEVGDPALLGPYRTLFAGQTKTRSDEEFSYPIPLLAEPQIVQAGIEKLRAHPYCQKLQELDNNAVHRRTSADINGHCKRHFGLRWTPKLLRAFYAAYCYYLYAPEHYDEVVYLGEILGHQHGGETPDLLTPQSYQQWFKIVD